MMILINFFISHLLIVALSPYFPVSLFIYLYSNRTQLFNPFQLKVLKYQKYPFKISILPNIRLFISLLWSNACWIHVCPVALGRNGSAPWDNRRRTRSVWLFSTASLIGLNEIERALVRYIMSIGQLEKFKRVARRRLVELFKSGGRDGDLAPFRLLVLNMTSFNDSHSRFSV